eukprot:1884742-Pyramimonas_sp.AAC.1
MWPPARPSASSGSADRGIRFARTVFIHGAEKEKGGEGEKEKEEGGGNEKAAVADEGDDQRTQDGDSTVASSA